jgi:membrane protein implicated in regulation of membrane protease activity
MTGRVMSLFAVILLGGAAAGAPLTAAVITLAGPRPALVVSAIATFAAVAGSRALLNRRNRPPAAHTLQQSGRIGRQNRSATTGRDVGAAGGDPPG